MSKILSFSSHLLDDPRVNFLATLTKEPKELSFCRTLRVWSYALEMDSENLCRKDIWMSSGWHDSSFADFLVQAEFSWELEEEISSDQKFHLYDVGGMMMRKMMMNKGFGPTASHLQRGFKKCRD